MDNIINTVKNLLDNKGLLNRTTIDHNYKRNILSKINDSINQKFLFIKQLYNKLVESDENQTYLYNLDGDQYIYMPDMFCYSSILKIKVKQDDIVLRTFNSILDRKQVVKFSDMAEKLSNELSGYPSENERCHGWIENEKRYCKRKGTYGLTFKYCWQHYVVCEARVWTDNPFGSHYHHEEACTNRIVTETDVKKIKFESDSLARLRPLEMDYLLFLQDNTNVNVEYVLNYIEKGYGIVRRNMYIIASQNIPKKNAVNTMIDAFKFYLDITNTNKKVYKNFKFNDKFYKYFGSNRIDFATKRKHTETVDNNQFLTATQVSSSIKNGKDFIEELFKKQIVCMKGRIYSKKMCHNFSPPTDDLNISHFAEELRMLFFIMYLVHIMKSNGMITPADYNTIGSDVQKIALQAAEAQQEWTPF